MTQPNSVNMTFDTSLVDLNASTSFSTTESDLSDAGFHATASTMKTPTLQQASLIHEQSQETPKQSRTTPIQHLPTQDAYNQWASVYDFDGNMLVAIDDLELSTLLPNFLSQVIAQTPSPNLNLIDLGCGTGRNTTKLLSHPWPKNLSIGITALDFSSGMLAVAAKKLATLPLPNPNPKPTFRLEQCDCFPTVSSPTASPFPSLKNLHPVHAVLSTLVLEHIPLNPYFATLASLLVEGGYALVTNMHSEMGVISQAGFINEQGVKVRGTSFAHTPKETAEEAQRAGFQVVELRERRMERGDVESGVVGERGEKWVGVLVWYGLLLRKVV